MRSSLLTVVGLVSLALAAPSMKRETDEEATDRFLFNTPIADFEAARGPQIPATLNWESDGCSSSPDNPLGFDFLQSCHRHDFGYRNYQAQNRFSEENRQTIDENFKKDMDAQCEQETLTNSCKVFADVYFTVVRQLGTAIPRN